MERAGCGAGCVRDVVRGIVLAGCSLALWLLVWKLQRIGPKPWMATDGTFFEDLSKIDQNPNTSSTRHSGSTRSARLASGGPLASCMAFPREGCVRPRTLGCTALLQLRQTDALSTRRERNDLIRIPRCALSVSARASESHPCHHSSCKVLTRGSSTRSAALRYASCPVRSHGHAPSLCVQRAPSACARAGAASDGPVLLTSIITE